MGLPARYDLDPADLEARYRELSKVLHPDRHAQKPANERRLNLGKAVEVNEAYRALKDDLSRAAALLELKGHVVGGRGGPGGPGGRGGQEPAAEPAFLMEVMELREELADARKASDIDRVGRLGETVSAKLRAATSEMADAFTALGAEAEDVAPIAALLGRLRYYRRFLDEVEVIEEEAMG
jgi:molecular chaperone HscB